MFTRQENDVIVNKPKDLTRKWAQGILNRYPSPELRFIKVRKVEVASVDVGTTSRVRLVVDHDGPRSFPRRWFVKLPSQSRRARMITALPRLLPTEIRFYNEIAGSLPVNRPMVISAHSRFGKGSTLVLNDVSELGAIAGRTGESLTAAQAGRVIEDLAYFHAHFRHKAKNDPSLNWLAGPVRRLEDGLGTVLAVPLMKRGLRLAYDWVSATLFKPALRYAANRRQVMSFLSGTEATLVHHDCHPGNLFWSDSKVGFFDWQMARIGEGVSDVSYFLATALEPEIRRVQEIELLTRYHEILLKQGATSQNFADLFARYRAHLAYPFEAMVVTLAVGGMMQFESNLAMIRRSAQAIEDHDTFGVLAKAVWGNRSRV